MARLNPLGTFGLATTYVAQYLSAAALICGAIGLFLGSVGLAAFDNALHSQLALLIIAVLIFLPGFFFLLPNRFDRALASMRYGTRRVMGGITFFLLGGSCIVGWIGIKLIYDIFDEPRGVSGVMAIAMLIWLISYTLSFLLPGLAFRREDPSEDTIDLWKRVRKEPSRAYVPEPKLTGRMASFAERRARHLDESSYSHRIKALQAELDGKRGGEPSALQKLYMHGAPLVLFALPLVAALKFSARWLPMGDYGSFVSDYKLAIAAGVAALVMPAVYMGTAKARGIFRAPLARLISTTVIGVLTFALWGNSAIYAYPHVASYLTRNTYGAVVVNVVAQGQDRSISGCDWAATIAMAEEPTIRWQICGLPQDLWRGLHPGDTLVLTGETNSFGMRYQVVQRLS